MGMYIFVSEQDRIAKRKVTDSEVNESFQEALKCDPSLIIEERTAVIKKWFKTTEKIIYSLYHETPALDGSAYQARWQHSGSGSKEIAIAYLHGIINGVTHIGNKNSYIIKGG
jgi:hypothetical protein